MSNRPRVMETLCLSPGDFYAFEHDDTAGRFVKGDTAIVLGQDHPGCIKILTSTGKTFAVTTWDFIYGMRSVSKGATS